ncbi:MAG TPA: LLM class flavin-dependent oxidoreductase [Acidimicrobiales bacterium]|nr:LLM class flavin-dependent oxidoreductase [Acidimicrobiales bacterium]
MTQYYMGFIHERNPPDVLLKCAVEAEKSGFDGVACSDHFQPWWEPGQAGQAFVWLGASLQATNRVPFGTAVTSSMYRYHPALLAQVFATLEVMYPGRVFLGIGSGESLNESPFGGDWPSPRGQLEALEEALQLIVRLFDGERVDHSGRFFRTKGAYLHTRPERRPPIYVAAFGRGAARLAGRYADGLLTVGDPEVVAKVKDAWLSAADDAGRDPGELVLQAGFSWAPDDETAFNQALVFKGTAPAEYYSEDWHDPREMHKRGMEKTSDEEFTRRNIISSDPEVHVERLREVEKLGATVISCANFSGPNVLEAVWAYGSEVLPRLRKH